MLSYHLFKILATVIKIVGLTSVKSYYKLATSPDEKHIVHPLKAIPHLKKITNNYMHSKKINGKNLTKHHARKHEQEVNKTNEHHLMLL